MATWITHLQIAGLLYQSLPALEAQAFMVGSIAPDSGVPNEDWSQFTPPSNVSHFDENKDRKAAADRYRAIYLTPEKMERYDLQALSFHLGYLSHLMTDALWRESIVQPSRETFSRLFADDPKGAIWILKKDWYDLDFLYLEQHPEFRPWKLYREACGFENRYLDIFSKNSFDLRREYIVRFYGEKRENLNREYHYLSKAQMDEFVRFAAEKLRPAIHDLAKAEKIL